MPHEKDQASGYHTGGGTVRKHITPKGSIIIGGVAIPIAALIAGLAWATNNLANIKLDRDLVKTNKQGIAEVKSDTNEIKAALQGHEVRLTVMETEHKHMMDDIKRQYTDNKATMEDVKQLMQRLINGD